MSLLYWGAKNWTQNSRLWTQNTSAQWRGRITTLNLLTTLFVMQPKISSTFFVVRVHCWMMWSLLSPGPPVYFLWNWFPVVWPPEFMVPGIVSYQLQDFTLLVEAPEVTFSPFLPACKGWMAAWPSGLSSFNSTLCHQQAHDEGVKQDWTQHWPLDTSLPGLLLVFVPPLSGLRYSGNFQSPHSLLIQPILYQLVCEQQFQRPYWSLGNQYPLLSPHLPVELFHYRSLLNFNTGHESHNTTPLLSQKLHSPETAHRFYSVCLFLILHVLLGTGTSEMHLSMLSLWRGSWGFFYSYSL